MENVVSASMGVSHQYRPAYGRTLLLGSPDGEPTCCRPSAAALRVGLEATKKARAAAELTRQRAEPGGGARRVPQSWLTWCPQAVDTRVVE